MSMQFSDTTNRTGIIELIEDLTTTKSATTSSYPLATKTRDVNNAFANFNMLAQRSAGSWESDDTNQTDYPIITTNLVSGQQDYSFVLDQQGNQILDIYRVEIANASGIFSQVVPLDEVDMNGVSLTEFMKTSGTTIFYRKTANGIFLYAPTSYNYTNGLKIYYARTPTYFLSTDTTKKPGIPDMFHEYLALRPAYFYALSKGLPQAAALGNQVIEYEGNDRLGVTGKIGDYYANRSRDLKTAIRTIYRPSR
jgi:hypothetical protein